MKKRPQGIETRKRVARFRSLAWSPESAPRAPECQPMQEARARIARGLAAATGTAPPRGTAVGHQLAAAAALLRGGAR